MNQRGYKMLDCDGSSPSRPRVYVGGLADGVMSLYEESKQTYINGSGSYGQGRSFYVDNTAPLIQMDAANTNAFEDGTLQLSAVSPTPMGWWSDFPDSIAKVEFFARLADNTTVSLGSVASEKDKPWKLQALLPAGAARNGGVTLFAVATDLVYSRRETPVNRTGTSTDLTVAGLVHAPPRGLECRHRSAGGVSGETDRASDGVAPLVVITCHRRPVHYAR